MELDPIIPQHRAATDDPRFETISELVDTERGYVRNLGELCDLKQTLIQQRLLDDNHVQKLFSNIDSIYNLHQRFLVDVESLSRSDHGPSGFAGLFVQYEDDFRVYLPYLANTCMFDRKSFVRGIISRIKVTGHRITQDIQTLDLYLLRPYSRYVKYNVLLKVI